MESTGRATVQVERRFSSAPEFVFDAWFDEINLGAWLFATPEGRMLKVQVDPRSGGGFLIIEERAGEAVPHEGRYEIVDRPRRLSFLFSVKSYSSEETRVVVDLVPEGEGTHLTLTHESVLPDYAERTKNGWSGILARLAIVLGEK